MRNDHFFPAKVSPKSQKSSKKAYFVKICCPKGAGALWGPAGGPPAGSRGGAPGSPFEIPHENQKSK